MDVQREAKMFGDDGGDIGVNGNLNSVRVAGELSQRRHDGRLYFYPNFHQTYYQT